MELFYGATSDKIKESTLKSAPGYYVEEPYMKVRTCADIQGEIDMTSQVGKAALVSFLSFFLFILANGKDGGRSQDVFECHVVILKNFIFQTPKMYSHMHIHLLIVVQS